MLEAKCAEIADCMNNLSKQQHDSALKEEHTAVVKQRLNAVQKELEHTKASEQLCQSMHATQCHQYENQIEAVSAYLYTCYCTSPFPCSQSTVLFTIEVVSV